MHDDYWTDVSGDGSWAVLDRQTGETLAAGYCDDLAGAREVARAARAMIAAFGGDVEAAVEALFAHVENDRTTPGE